MLLLAGWSIVATLLAAGSHAVPAATPIVTRVRPASVEIGDLLADAARRSATVRQLLARLEVTDAIVYVELTASPQIPTARTTLVTSTPGARFIRIGINAGTLSGDRAPLLGHELQHALEIAEHVEIHDERTVRALYGRIGRARGPDAFETDAAKSIESSVRAELRMKGR